MLTLVAGLAIVLAHNVWRGGAMAVVVTVLGWLLLLKGAALVVIPPACVGRHRAGLPLRGSLPDGMASCRWSWAPT